MWTRLRTVHPLYIVVPVVGVVAILMQRRFFSRRQSCDHEQEDVVEVAPEYVLSYSSTSGSIFAALKDLLQQMPHWSMAPPPQKLRLMAPNRRWQGVNLVLGDRTEMERLIAEWKESIAQIARMRARGHSSSNTGRHVVLVNYYTGSKHLTLKVQMLRNLRKHMKRPYDITPLTYIISPGTQKDERERFRQEFDARRDREDNVWIVKGSGRNKAKGIRVMRDYDEIMQYTREEGPNEVWVVQLYLTSPYLIHGRKFDIRTWVIVDPNYSSWLWDEGVLRTSSEQYTLDDLSELSHLTNHCVQEHGPNYGKYEVGNEMWYHQFEQYLQRNDPGRNFHRDAVPQIRHLIDEALQSVKSRVIHSCTYGNNTMLCYQVFGFDFMVDADFKVWLIEVNGQPAVAEALLPAFTRESLSLLIHTTFPPPNEVTVPPHRFSLIRQGAALKPSR